MSFKDFGCQFPECTTFEEWSEVYKLHHLVKVLGTSQFEVITVFSK